MNSLRQRIPFKFAEVEEDDSTVLDEQRKIKIIFFWILHFKCFV
jgi:hypothetical protein